MSATYAARASRQTTVLTAILGMHIGLFFLIASGLGPRVFEELRKSPPPVMLLPPAEEAVAIVKPRSVPLDDPYHVTVPEPVLELPEFNVTEPIAASTERSDREAIGAGTRIARSNEMPPRLRMRDRRLAALIDACYPAASRRLGEEGRVIARVAIAANGRAQSWRVVRTSGFSRLDEAVGCVIERLDFVAGRRDGGAVEAEAELPIAFHLD